MEVEHSTTQTMGGAITDEELHIRAILKSIGEDPSREGLKETPKRYLRMLYEFLKPVEFNFTTFSSDGMDEMIVEQDIPFYSICEHHLVPFFGTAVIAYIPNGKIVGLSKLPRALDHFANKLQNQERITKQVAEFIKEKLHPKGVAVSLKARHLCMEMRGVKKPGVFTTTTALLGSFKEDNNARNEFLRFVR